MEFKIQLRFGRFLKTCPGDEQDGQRHEEKIQLLKGKRPPTVSVLNRRNISLAERSNRQASLRFLQIHAPKTLYRHNRQRFSCYHWSVGRRRVRKNKLGNQHAARTTTRNLKTSLHNERTSARDILAFKDKRRVIHQLFFMIQRATLSGRCSTVGNGRARGVIRVSSNHE